jgi:hypothetical protein
MPAAYKVLGQSNPSATTLTTLYNAPASTQAVASTLTICNQGATLATYRVAVRPAGATVAAQHYIIFDSAVAAYDTVFLTVGVAVAATDVVSVFASTSSVSFSLFGVEIT